MRNNIEERVIEEAKYILDKKTTVRELAKVFGWSKSTVHIDLEHRLPRINSKLYKKVRQVLDKNKEERHLRGGMATAKLYHCI